MTEIHKQRIGMANQGRKSTKQQRKAQSVTRKELYASGELIHWSKTDKLEQIAKKISEKRKGKSFIKTIKKGRFEMNRGYIMVFVRNHPIKGTGYILEHRVVMEQHIGRELRPEEDVHHIDGDKTNNSIDNLMLFPTRSAHIKFHQRN